MKRLFYVRHGETEMNVQGVLSGRTETPLTSRGKEQAAETGKAVKQKLPPIDLIIASPFERTFETAKIIANEIGYLADKIVKNDLFIERSFGVLEGSSGKDFLAKHEYRDLDTVEGAETIEGLDKRAAEAFKYLSSLQDDNILVVGHGSFGRALRRVVNNLPHTHEYEVKAIIGNASIVELI